MKRICSIVKLLLESFLLLLVFCQTEAIADCYHWRYCNSNSCAECGQSNVSFHYVEHTANASYTYVNNSTHKLYYPCCGTTESNKHDWSYGETCTSIDANNHQYICYSCGGKIHENHYFNTYGVCTACEYKRTGADDWKHEETGKCPEGGNHDGWNYFEQVSPTCTEYGYTVIECAKCGEKYKEYIKPLGHTTSNGVCGNCGQLINKETTQKEKTEKSKKNSKTTKKSSSKNSDIYTVKCQLEPDGDEIEAKIVTLGISNSVVAYEGTNYNVSTKSITFAEGIPDEKKLAIISSKKVDKVTMYKTNKKGDYGKIKVGTILPVLAIEDEYILIHYNSRDGYIKSANVDLVEPCAPINIGVVGNKTKTVKYRIRPKKNGSVLGSIKSGTALPIFAELEDWYQIEYNGMRGYIKKEFVNFAEVDN